MRNYLLLPLVTALTCLLSQFALADPIEANVSPERYREWAAERVDMWESEIGAVDRAASGESPDLLKEAKDDLEAIEESLQQKVPAEESSPLVQRVFELERKLELLWWLAEPNMRRQILTQTTAN